MSSVPTIPSVPSGGAGIDVGPQGITLSANLTLDRCNARPVMIYVVPQEGKIWQLVDPLSPAEKIPVWKQWTEEKTVPQGHWERRELPPPPPEQPPPQQPERPGPRCETVEYAIPGTVFKFDEPGKAYGVTDRRAYSSDGPGPDQISADVDSRLDAPMSGGSRLPASITKKIVMFAHADMTASFSYNKSLTDRRGASIQHFLSGRARGAVIQRSACSDFNPSIGPNAHEQAAERSTSGFATNPGPDPANGNVTNRKIELFILPDYTNPSDSVLAPMLNQIHDELVGARAGDARRSISAGEWRRGGFPCNGGIRTCHKLMEPFDSADDRSSVSLEQRRHHNVDASGNPTGDGPAYRQCAFYKLFKERVRSLNVCEQPPTQPTTPIEPTEPGEPRTQEYWVEDPPKKEQYGEYQPPKGEHYGFHMKDMVEQGVVCNPLFAPTVSVAPNEQENPDDFNLIRAGPIQVVKMDIGFWGDERTRDNDRQAGFRRVPARYFGMIEGQFVFLCYFETDDNAGFVQACSEEFDEEVTPLAFKLAQAVRDAGHKILIMAKAVAEDGPDPEKLNIFFPDMHLPRKFDEKDPEYATDQCLFRAQMVKSMVLHQLKRDYRLPAVETPWLSVEDRQMCRDFFEGQTDGTNAERLKLPQYSSGRAFSNPFDPEGSSPASQAADAVKKAYQALMQVGFYLFEFTQDDYRRMVRKYSDNFLEKGYGRTKDALFNWYYGFETDRNIPPAPGNAAEEFGKSFIPGIVADVADEHFGTNLGPDPGTKPATESFDRIDAGPSRDLLRFLNVLEQEDDYTRVFHTGDLYELWVNRRFLYEDFKFPDDPEPQMPGLAEGLMPGDQDLGDMSFMPAAGEVVKFLVRSFVTTLLGGINADETDLWFRRECNRFALDGQLGPETSFRLNDDDFSLGDFSGPSTPGTIGLSVDNITPPDFDYKPDQMFDESQERGNAYQVREANKRMQQVEAFEAPLREDDQGRQEDLQLLGSANVRRTRGDDPQGLWNKAVVEKFADLDTIFIYGNHDCYRGLPRPGGISEAKPFHSEPGLWVEHGHRFEDSNVDGQPFGAFITNLAYEIQELPFAEGLLDEFALHREQDLFQPGVMQWFLLTQFGQDSLSEFQNPPANVPAVEKFRITVNSHTHRPDLVVGQFIFGQRERDSIDLPLVGSVGLDDIYNGGAALVKGLIFINRLIEWWEKWDQRNGFDKWWEDIKGNTIDWGVDFAGLADCVDRAIDFANGKWHKITDELERAGRDLGDAVDDNF